MRHIAFLSFLIILSNIVSPNMAYAWGQTGHRITGAIASNHLSDSAKAAIESLLPNQSLAEASTYADEMKSNPSEYWQKTASSFHYVTVKEGKKYHRAPKKGDAVSALKHFKAVLLDEKTSRTEKQLALRFTVHLIGDLHQPLHSGNGTDRGGNDRKLSFFWADSNLHRVWDSGIIDQKKLSYTEWTEWLDKKITDENISDWQKQLDPKIWIGESIVIRDRIYPETNSISYGYLYENVPTLKRRLQQAGIRMAAYLNEIYKP